MHLARNHANRMLKVVLGGIWYVRHHWPSTTKSFVNESVNLHLAKFSVVCSPLRKQRFVLLPVVTGRP